MQWYYNHKIINMHTSNNIDLRYINKANRIKRKKTVKYAIIMGSINSTFSKANVKCRLKTQ